MTAWPAASMRIAFGIAIIWGGCLSVTALAGSRAIASIRYSVNPCFGDCPIYSIDIAANGKGRFRGIAGVAAIGVRHFSATPAQIQRFIEILDRVRPVSGDSLYDRAPLCISFKTDHPSIDVVWTRPNGLKDHLFYSMGCDDGHPEISAPLRAAIKALPVTALIGPRGFPK
jgi:Domain of unknown function (DUF6438)